MHLHGPRANRSLSRKSTMTPSHRFVPGLQHTTPRSARYSNLFPNLRKIPHYTWHREACRVILFSNLPSGSPHCSTMRLRIGFLRKPVHHFTCSDLVWKARYPARNYLIAKFDKGPGTEELWIPTQIYAESPFPIFKNAAAKTSMEKLAEMRDAPRYVETGGCY